MRRPLFGAVGAVGAVDPGIVKHWNMFFFTDFPTMAMVRLPKNGRMTICHFSHVTPRWHMSLVTSFIENCNIPYPILPQNGKLDGSISLRLQDHLHLTSFDIIWPWLRARLQKSSLTREAYDQIMANLPGRLGLLPCAAESPPGTAPKSTIPQSDAWMATVSGFFWGRFHMPFIGILTPIWLIIVGYNGN